MSKSFVLATTFVFVFGLVAISNISSAAAGSIMQEEAKAAPQPVATPATPVQEASPSDVIVTPDTVTQDAVVQESVLQGAVPVPMTQLQAPVMGSSACCDSCCEPCDCPVEMTLCLVDHCGCTHEVCVTVPASCVNEAPQVTWRDGILGRKIAKLCWPCCGKRVKVVIPVFGGPRVFDLR